MIQFPDLNIPDVPVNINDNGNSDSRFCRRNPNSKEGKKESLGPPVKKIAVEYGKIYIHRIQYQLDRNQYRQQISPGKKTVNPGKKHNGAHHQIILHMYHNLPIVCGKARPFPRLFSMFYPLFRAIIIPPIIQASNNTLIASKGSIYWYFSVPSKANPICFIPISPGVK